MNKTLNILLLPGDGIGPDVIAVARMALEHVARRGGLHLAFSELPIGGAAIDAHGVPLPDHVLAAARAADAVLLGAVGGPKWAGVDYARRPEAGLLAIRAGMGLFANLRPALIFDALLDASTLKPDVVRGLDILIVRELTGGIYFGQPRGIETLADGQRRGVNTQHYTTHEIHRVARVAFDLARARGRRLCSVDKANVMESGVLWREEVTKLHAADYADVALSHMYVDNCAMQLLRAPRDFDVILTDNLFGDILSDEAAMLTGSIGMLPSASLGALEDGKRPALYEPVHGSAPDIAGQDRANPLAAILSAAMLLRFSADRADLAAQLEAAVARVLEDGVRTADLAARGQAVVGCRAMGDAVMRALNV